MKKLLINKVGLLFLYVFFLYSCKDTSIDIPEKKSEKWRTIAKEDSEGNKYYVVSTLQNTLEIRVDNKEGKTIFSKKCPTIDSSEIPKVPDLLLTFLVSPNKFINVNGATLSLRIILDDLNNQKKYIQMLANIDLHTKNIYTKKYKVLTPQDWTYSVLENNLVQWYQNTLLVREGTDKDLYRGGGHMGLGQRGTLLVCYENNFSIRYTKDIDATDAYYPSGGTPLIPINNYEYMLFRSDGIVARLQIVTSVEDVWQGKKNIIWYDNINETNNIPKNYSVKIIDYNINNDIVWANYSILDEKKQYSSKLSKKWSLTDGSPLNN